jgi:hypothetical protein
MASRVLTTGHRPRATSCSLQEARAGVLTVTTPGAVRRERAPNRAQHHHIAHIGLMGNGYCVGQRPRATPPSPLLRPATCNAHPKFEQTVMYSSDCRVIRDQVARRVTLFFDFNKGHGIIMLECRKLDGSGGFGAC